jgi:hypothetical protein
MCCSSLQHMQCLSLSWVKIRHRKDDGKLRIRILVSGVRVCFCHALLPKTETPRPLCKKVADSQQIGLARTIYIHRTVYDRILDEILAKKLYVHHMYMVLANPTNNTSIYSKSAGTAMYIAYPTTKTSI